MNRPTLEQPCARKKNIQTYTNYIVDDGTGEEVCYIELVGLKKSRRNILCLFSLAGDVMSSAEKRCDFVVAFGFFTFSINCAN
jgi:hypothetical protein